MMPCCPDMLQHVLHKLFWGFNTCEQQLSKLKRLTIFMYKVMRCTSGTRGEHHKSLQQRSPHIIHCIEHICIISVRNKIPPNILPTHPAVM
uniref:Uncharacterized protein n=1 Tax=Arundo donax TaxID=35708 RepID=A0A0A9I069_ARUDO